MPRKLLRLLDRNIRKLGGRIIHCLPVIRGENGLKIDWTNPLTWVAVYLTFFLFSLINAAAYLRELNDPIRTPFNRYADWYVDMVKYLTNGETFEEMLEDL